jgi:DNA-binding NarL/FixJ family response regulator
MKAKNITIAIVDDHELLRNGLVSLISNLGSYQVLFEAGNGKELIEQLNPDNLPDIVLLDINMPEMDGYETALWLKRKYPRIKILALSMYDTETAIIRMLKNGAKGYILKNTRQQEFLQALDSLIRKGYYFSELVSGKVVHALNVSEDPDEPLGLLLSFSEREIEFIKLACTELSYKEIADQMCVSPRTVENYRDSLHERLNIKTRVGLVMYAIRNGIINT